MFRHILSWIVGGYSRWIRYRYSNVSKHEPHHRYYLTDTQERLPVDELDTYVPEECAYIEEWVDSNGHKKCVVAYEGDDIPTSWSTTPFDVPALCPWVWVGDRDTEVDFTRVFDKFLVVGNKITPDLIRKVVHVTDRTHLSYVETGTFKVVDFPGDKITIQQDAD